MRIIWSVRIATTPCIESSKKTWPSPRNSARSRDLALVVSDAPATISGVFTRSSVVGAPVEWPDELTKPVLEWGRAAFGAVERNVEQIGTPQQIDEFAPPIDHLAGYFGRRP